MAARLQGMAQLMCRAPGDSGLTTQWVDDELWPQGWRMSVGPSSSAEPAGASATGSRRRAQALHPALQAFPAPDRAGRLQAQAWADWWESGGAWKDGRTVCAPLAGPAAQAHDVSDLSGRSLDQALSQSMGEPASHSTGEPRRQVQRESVGLSASHSASHPLIPPCGHPHKPPAGHPAMPAEVRVAAPAPRRAPLVISTSSGAGD